MKSKLQRLNNVIGQLEGVKKMIESEKDCLKVLIQIKAAKSALDSFASSYMAENMTECLNLKSEKDINTCNKFLKEIIK